jgi:hypothetical protein
MGGLGERRKPAKIWKQQAQHGTVGAIVILLAQNDAGRYAYRTPHSLLPVSHNLVGTGGRVAAGCKAYRSVERFGGWSVYLIWI